MTASMLSRRLFLRRVAVVAAALPLGWLAACTDRPGQRDGREAPAASPQPPMQVGEGAISTVVGAEDGPGEHRILMTREHRFDPERITIRSGETIIWYAASPGGHTSTTDGEKASDPSHARVPEGVEPWDSGLLVSDQEFRLELTVPGEYTYFCVPHQDMGMIGHITVED